MKILQRTKRVLQLVFDREIYYLAWLAGKNHFKLSHPADSAVLQTKQKQAKAGNSK